MIKIYNSEGLLCHLTPLQGPAADSTEAAEFRKFWGEKSALRRFQDGSFHEAVLWGDAKQSVGQRRLIPEQVCRWVLEQQLGIKKKNITFVNRQAEALLHHQMYEKDYG